MRLPGRLKHGYYPTPSIVVEMIATFLAPAKAEQMVWLDPTCGEGYALSGLAQRVGNKPLLHGVEWDADRARRAATQLDDVLTADVNGVIFPTHGYDLFWFNPPYDWNRFKTEATKDEKRESGVMFRNIFGYNAPIQHTNNVLVQPGGIFIGILPATDIQYLLHDLWRHFMGPQDDTDEQRSYPLIFQFPDPEYEEFGQYVILGRRRKRSLAGVKDEIRTAVLEGIEFETHPRLTWQAEPLFKLLGVPKDQIGNMKTRIYDPVNGAQVALKYGFGARPALTNRYWPPAKRPLQPVLTLQDAHMAQLLASGALQPGTIFDTSPEGGLRYVMRGRTKRKRQRISEEKDEFGKVTKWVEREVWVTEILTIDEDGNPQWLRVTETQPNEDGEKKPSNPLIERITPPSYDIKMDTPYANYDEGRRMV